MIAATSRYEVPAVRRGSQILRLLAAADSPMGVTALSRSLGLPKASVFRIVISLELEGFVERLDGNRFQIGRSAFEVGAAYTRDSGLESAFRTVAKRLVAEHNETVQLAILVDTDVLYIGREESSEPVRLVSRLGTRLPASCTALGKALLSGLSAEQLRSLLPHRGLVQLTSNSHHYLASLAEDLELARRRGWAHDMEEAAVGLQCFASPIRDAGGNHLAAISIAVPSQRVSSERQIVLGQAVKAAAFEISRMLGHRVDGRDRGAA